MGIENKIPEYIKFKYFITGGIMDKKRVVKKKKLVDMERLNEIRDMYMSYGDNWTDRAFSDLLEYITYLENEISRYKGIEHD